MTIFIESSKTDTLRQGHTSIIAAMGTSLCPVKNLADYLLHAGIPDDSDEFIFRGMNWIKSKKQHVLRALDKPVSYSRVREILQQAVASIGMDPSDFGTHSFRSGGPLCPPTTTRPTACLSDMGDGVVKMPKMAMFWTAYIRQAVSNMESGSPALSVKKITSRIYNQLWHFTSNLH